MLLVSWWYHPKGGYSSPPSPCTMDLRVATIYRMASTRAVLVIGSPSFWRGATTLKHTFTYLRGRKPRGLFDICRGDQSDNVGHTFFRFDWWAERNMRLEMTLTDTIQENWYAVKQYTHYFINEHKEGKWITAYFLTIVRESLIIRCKDAEHDHYL